MAFLSITRGVIMLKNFFKSSVSAFVLLGTLSTLDPIHAGNTHPGGNGRNEEIDEKSEKASAKKRNRRQPQPDAPAQNEISPDLRYILTPFGAPSNESLNQEESSPEQNPTGKSKKQLVRESKKARRYNQKHSDFSRFPAELTQLILFHADPETILRAQLVCKDWNRLIESGKQTRLNLLNNPAKEDEQKNPNFLRTLLFHPSTLVAGHRELASRYFEEVIRPTLAKVPESPDDTENSEPEPTIIGSVESPDLHSLEIVENFTSVISRNHLPFLSRMYVHYDPSIHFKEVFLASHTIKESPEMQDLLKQVTHATSFEMADFPKLVKNQKNHQGLKQHLMALKILTLSGNEEAKERMKAFNEVLLSYYEAFSNDPDQFVKKNPSFLNGPLWGAYTVKTEPDVNNPELHTLSLLMQSKHSLGLELEPIRAFAGYIFTVAPQNSLWFYGLLDDVEYLQKGLHAPSSALLNSLDSQYKELDKRNLPELARIAPIYSSIGSYDRALQILKDAHERVGNSPFRFKILWQMAECILNWGDSTLLDQAGEYLQTIWEEVQRQNLPTPNLDTSFAATFGEGEEKQIINESDELDLYDVLVSRVAFHIYKGNFKDAERLLKEYYLTSETDLEACPGLIKSVQAQISHMPKSLVKIFGQEFLRFSSKSLETPEMRRFIHENKDAFGRLLQGHYFDKRKFKRAMKDVPFSADGPQEGDPFKGKEKQKKKRKKKEREKKKEK
jgi:hypothetical protein